MPGTGNTSSGEIHHPPNARFQSGNRVYKVVILGQGGVGKSGKGRIMLDDSHWPRYYLCSFNSTVRQSYISRRP